MTNYVLQGARAAAPYIARTAGQAALVYANASLSSLLGNTMTEGPRLQRFQFQTSEDGAPMPRLFGRARIAGQIIWASSIKENAREESVGSTGKGGGDKVRTYSYTMSFAVGLCEGEISGIGQIWANGERLSSADINYRLYHGNETQSADPLIEMLDGPDTPTYRGTAYIVFEDFPLDNYGARLPQLNFEVFRQPKNVTNTPRLEELVCGVDLIPGSGENVYSPSVQEEIYASGNTKALNMNNLQGQADIALALDQLEQHLPNCKSVSIVVSWFGDSLDCGVCKLRPGIETIYRTMKNVAWSVGNITCTHAWQISQDENGNANYGGTPSDASVIALIKELKARGFKVAFYPFILMDMKDPDFPWAGRISAMPESQDQTPEVEAQVQQFFGTATPPNFDVASGKVVYTGPQEDSFRRMILHYAAVSKLAGGVDSFVIGSELRGLTTIRGVAHSYPAVSELVSLAADVRAIVGVQTQLTYAADWSEYFGHHADGDLHFHLDSLWASPNIDAVGIDAYFPLSDWRDEETHLDATTYTDPYNLSYLQANIEGGEGYEWYYETLADRDAQNRTSITDGLAGKPWVYRYKDMKNWWSNSHCNRENGI